MGYPCCDLNQFRSIIPADAGMMESVFLPANFLGRANNQWTGPGFRLGDGVKSMLQCLRRKTCINETPLLIA
jgi:hypothetical protein